MAQVNLGRIGFVNKGSWNSVTNYKLNDVVKYGGSTYAAKRPNVGITPPTNGTDTDDWFYFVNNSDYVDKTSNQTIAGIKTFSSVISGNISGNSATATKLATARTINGVAFDGSANITISTSSDSTAVKLTEDQTVAGIKTFSSSPIVPTPTANTQAANKAYVDSASSGGAAWIANDTRAKTALNASGTAPIYACRAWVNFNGTRTVAIRASGNVSSITDNGAGRYTVNFTTAMPDANYSVATSSRQDSDIDENAYDMRVGRLGAFLTTHVNVVHGSYNNNNSNYLDCLYGLVSIFR